MYHIGCNANKLADDVTPSLFPIGIYSAYESFSFPFLDKPVYNDIFLYTCSTIIYSNGDFPHISFGFKPRLIIPEQKRDIFVEFKYKTDINW